MNKTLYPTIAAAMGGWFAAELVLAMQHPERMWDEEGEPAGETTFSGPAFDQHLLGLVSDVWEYCAAHLPADKPVYLCSIAPGSDEREPATVEVQPCLQGNVWFESAEVEYEPAAN